MVIEFVKVQHTTSVKGVGTWLWLAWQPIRVLVPGNVTSDHSWVRLEKSWLGAADWEALRELVDDNWESPSLSSAGSAASPAASAWRRWHIRRTEHSWQIVAKSEPWPELILKKSVAP